MQQLLEDITCQQQAARDFFNHSKLEDTIEEIKKDKSPVLKEIAIVFDEIYKHNVDVADAIENKYTNFDLNNEIESFKPNKNGSEKTPTQKLGRLYDIINELLVGWQKLSETAGLCKKAYTDQLFGKNNLENVIEEINKLSTGTKKGDIDSKFLKPLKDGSQKIKTKDLEKIGGFAGLAKCIQEDLVKNGKCFKSTAEKIKKLKEMK